MARYRLIFLLAFFINLLYPASIFSATPDFPASKQLVLAAVNSWTTAPRQALEITSQFAESDLNPEQLLLAYPASPWILRLRWLQHDRSFYYSSLYEDENHRGLYRGGNWSGYPAPYLYPGPLSQWPLLPWPGSEGEIHFLGTKQYADQWVKVYDFQPPTPFISPHWQGNVQVISSRYLLFITQQPFPRLVAGEYYWRLRLNNQPLVVAMKARFNY
ncbi:MULTISPECIES: hypothetical protein [Carboxydocella]|uniref:Uncharacterized protein n=2 Tax=Carboxydocella TaxID=178898 RepID=A0A1T4Q8D4_9FIRM|nr:MULTISPECIES: hypothetical protein [Carboxydocella]AVX19332.1 hypothetical protein CFE_0122 [Carboxydocella thermautotrophica]AVX29746.1 hypothetical protein CTH_0126 [Carboxydocella thermautotrophica]SJZ99974.1 hypothetical protein SAMN02745885_01571 [Carboxydocella sporoproducens DSM 16521]GAW27444.1 hypothetical protein ULO1_00140 [Carboxydocella sp. ULO1]GAW30330.1 hypothetical protein JDF658_00950 [Carboxydocella sp. JDF658]